MGTVLRAAALLLAVLTSGPGQAAERVALVIGNGKAEQGLPIAWTSAAAAALVLQGWLLLRERSTCGAAPTCERISSPAVSN